MKVFLYIVGALLAVGVVGALSMRFFINPGVERDLIENPDGEQAKKVMLISLPSGKRIPVNYLREDGKVFAGADGPWWREFKDGPAKVEVLIQGETIKGTARLVLDDPEYKNDVFSRLRVNVPKWIPEFMDAYMIEITIEGA